MLFQHASYATGVFIAVPPDWLTTIVGKGYLGVDFFFVLSGFIILNAHFDDLPTAAALKLYTFKRIIRIYVPYLPISVAMIAIYFFLPDLSRNFRDWGWLTSVLLVPSSHPPALAVAWTLVHEMLFYVIFVLYFFNRLAFAAAIAVWTVALVIYPSAVQDGTDPESLTTALLNPINLEFCFGLACALIYRFVHARWAPGAIIVGVGILFFFFSHYETSSRLVFGLGIASVVLGAALREKGFGLRIPRVLVSAGDASYALYLIHVPAISIAVRLASHIAVLDNWLGAFCSSSCLAVLAGWIYYSHYERPTLIAIRKAAFRPRQPKSLSELTTPS